MHYPTDGRLYRCLGDYYDDASQRYAGRWFVSDDSLATLVRNNYALARKLNASNYQSSFRLGVIALQRADSALAESCFREAMAFDPHQPDPYYNLAYIFMQQNKPHQAIPLGQKAFDLYHETSLRSDAGQLLASCYMDLGQFPVALKYLWDVNPFDPSNFYVHRKILESHLEMGQSDSAFQAARRLFSLHPTYPRITQTIIEDYFRAEKSSDIPSVLRRLLPEYANSDSASGNLYFHLAQTLFEQSKGTLAAEPLDSAEVRFRHCYNAQDQVFEVIGSLRDAIKEQR